MINIKENSSVKEICYLGLSILDYLNREPKCEDYDDRMTDLLECFKSIGNRASSYKGKIYIRNSD